MDHQDAQDFAYQKDPSQALEQIQMRAQSVIEQVDAALHETVYLFEKCYAIYENEIVPALKSSQVEKAQSVLKDMHEIAQYQMSRLYGHSYPYNIKNLVCVELNSLCLFAEQKVQIAALKQDQKRRESDR